MNRILLFIVMICAATMQAQPDDYCGTSGVHEEWERYLSEHHDLVVRSQGCQVYVPLTVHIVGQDDGTGYFSLSKVFAALETLNKDFESTGIKFFLGGPLNYINNTKWYDHTSFSVGSQMMNENNVANTINNYIVDNPAGNCGYRAFNGDAVALAKSCTGPNDHTWAHEIGHWLSLPHPFFGWEGQDYDGSEETPTTLGNNRPVEKLDGSNCSEAADRICDTKPDYLSFRWGCDENNEYPDSLSDPNGVKFAVDGSLIMSYAFDRCQSRFSDGQVDEMCTYLQNWVPEVVSDAEPLDPVDIADTELIYPINDEVVNGAVQLQWEEDGNATYYVVELSAIANLSIVSLREVVYGTSLDVFGLKSDKKYFWRVRAMNEYDFSYDDNRSETESFFTGELSSTEDYYSKNLSIYPNPVSRNMNVSLSLTSVNSESIDLEVFNMEGLRFIRKEVFLKSGSNYLELNTSALPAGIYILNGSGELHNFQKKFVVE